MELAFDMQMDQMLETFSALLDRYETHRSYIARAKAHSEKFSKAVIEKVILDHEIKASEVADGVLPLVPDLQGRVSEIDDEKSAIIKDKADADESVEELLLRKEIGELSDEEYQELTHELRAKLEEANARVQALEEERAILAAAIDRWVGMAEEAGQATGVVEPAKPEPEPEVVDEIEFADEPMVDEINGEHAHLGVMAEDVSAVFDQEPAAAAVAISDDGSAEAIEVGPMDLDGDPVADVDFGFDEDGDEGGEIGVASVELNLVQGLDEGVEAEEIGVDLAVDLDEEAPAVAEEPRRALLLYQEGTAEEQIYPITEETLTIGRGRDNDIQIKNDSKVSRFHCKIYRKNGNYYIEDNKSSNGTLVNGELITERRLFGGEEVIIGETFFRFRIM